jgi:phytoene dehydrogenase-like protein
MMKVKTRDVVIIGAGHNALVAAALLAQAGIRPLVLERSDRPGGCARTSEIAPGFRCPTLSHVASIDPSIISTLGLRRRGLDIIRPPIAAYAPTRDGRALSLWTDAARASASIAAFSQADATRYPDFLDSMARISRVIRTLQGTLPPPIDNPSTGDIIAMLKAARAFRSLRKADAYRLLRWITMPVADLVGEWFDSEPLRATVAAGGVLGSFLAPRSAGSAAALLLLGAAEGHPIASGWQVRGGTGVLAEALAKAAQDAGAEIRTGADVTQILVQAGAARGVMLASGEEVGARTVVSGVDPKRTFLGLVDPTELGPDFLRRVRNIRAAGTLAKINYAVSGLPRFAGEAGGDPYALSGRIRLNPNLDAIERAFDAAKYGAVSEEPWIELTIPSVADAGLAPLGRHVISAYVQYTPYTLRGTTWDVERDRLGRVADRAIESYAPGFEASVIDRQVLTPLDLERTFGLTGGHVFHGELSLDQFFVTRPLLGWARYHTPIRNLYLCGSGTHPGTGLNGRSGALAAREIVRRFKR